MNKIDLIHSKYIARLSDALFEQWCKEYEWPERMRELLRVTALLHDIGKVVNYYSHARHSAYIIANSNLYGLTHREQAICGFMASNTHGANNKYIKNSPYGRLLKGNDLTILSQVSLLIAIAEAIDESHEQAAVSVSTEFTPKDIIVNVWTRANYNMSMADVMISKLTKQCKKDFKKNLIVKWHESL